VINTAICTAV